MTKLKSLLDQPVRNIGQSLYDDFIETNADFASSAGLKETITRIMTGKGCSWCASLEGTYDYPDDTPKDIYRRHDDCKCIFIHKSEKGIKNVHTKRTLTSQEIEKIEQRKAFKGVDVSKKNDIINKTEKAYMNQSNMGLKSGIKKERKKIAEHLDKIEHPEAYISDWGKKNKNYKAGIINKWRKEIENFQKQIKLREKELNRRK